MKPAIIASLVACVVATPTSYVISPRQSTSDQLFEALGPLGDFANQINDCIPADVSVAAVQPNGAIATINLDINPNDSRLDEILKCISNAVPVPVSSRPTSKRSPGLEIDLGGA